MSDPKNIIKRLRRVPKKQDAQDPLDAIISEMEAELNMNDMWQRDKKTVRDSNFKKARIVRGQNLAKSKEEQRVEDARLQKISEARLKNLKKAQRKLRRIRSTK